MESRQDEAPRAEDRSATVLELRTQYWRRVRLLSGALLSAWLLLTLAVPWFARDLNAWRMGRFPLGFWLGAQGAIVVFVLLIAIYAWVMDHLDRKFLEACATPSDVASMPSSRSQARS